MKIMPSIEAGTVAVVDWGSRDKVGGWLPLKKGVISTLVNFGFDEKNIVFATDRKQLGSGDYLVQLRSPLKPTVLTIYAFSERVKSLAVMRSLIELDIVGAPF